MSWLFIVLGVVLLVLGGDLVVRGAVEIATASGLSPRVIGLTVVAIGTSLPELASSMVASWKKEGDIVLGNVLGSNIFNVLGILGVTAIVSPFSVDIAATGTRPSASPGVPRPTSSSIWTGGSSSRPWTGTKRCWRGARR